MMTTARLVLVLAGMLAGLASLATQVACAEHWVDLPPQQNSRASLDVGSVHRMPSGPVSAWVRVEATNRAGTRSLQHMFGAFRGDKADFLYTIDCGSRQFSVTRAKLYQGAITVSEAQSGNDASWRRVDGVGLAGAVAHHLCTG